MIYDLLAPFYDSINKEIDYEGWADFFEKIFEKHLKNKPELVLDLGCGTGKMTLELARRGYDMTGVDFSVDMLNVARSEAQARGLDVLWLCQDMTDFELYGTVDAAVSCLDCINHLTEREELIRCLSLVHNYLIPDGIFIFDVNGKYKFENIYAENSYVMEEEEAVCVWQNFYDKATGLCDFLITLFSKTAEGLYEREDEDETERMYTLSDIRSALAQTGFEFLGAYGDFDFSPGSDESERIYIAARCKKVS